MSLRIAAVSGARSLSVSAGASVLLNLVQTVILSRLLQPRDFGLTAMIWAVVGFANYFADMGMSNAIIFKQDATRDQLSSVYWLNIASGSLIALLVWSSAPLFVFFYHETVLRSIVPWVALTFVTTAVGQQFARLAQRDLRFGVIALSEIIFAASGALVACLLAYFGFGVYALVYSGVVATIARSLFLAVAGWKQWHPSLHFAWNEVKSFLRFGAFQMGEKTANYWWSNVDYILVGRFLGSGTLGIYRLAYETVVRPLSIVNPIMNTVALPMFAKRQNDDDALRRGFLELVRLLATVTVPILAGLAVVAPYAVPVVFGPKWNEAVRIIQILCLLGIFRAISNPSGNIIIAKGMVEISFRWNVYMAVMNTVGFWLAVRHGIVALSWTAVTLMGLSVILSWKAFYHDTIRLSLRDYLRALATPLLLSLGMSIAVLLFLSLMKGAGFERNSQLLCLGISFGALTYLGGLLGIDWKYAIGVLRLLRGRPLQQGTENVI